MTISTVKGNLRVNLEQTFPPARRNVANWMPKKSKGGSYRRRQERRASDQLVQQRAAAHRARSSSSESSSELGETLASPEKERASVASSPSLLTSPAKDEDREELCSATLNPHLQITPEKEKEGDGPEEVTETAVGAEKPRPFIVVPEDFANRNNIENWQEKHWDDNNEKAEQAKCLMASTDQCCFCQFDCPTPSQLENENRFQGVLDSLWDHIEANHQLEWEWLG